MERLMEDIAAGGDARPTTRLIRARPPRNNLEICPTRCCEDCGAGVLPASQFFPWQREDFCSALSCRAQRRMSQK